MSTSNSLPLSSSESVGGPIRKTVLPPTLLVALTTATMAVVLSIAAFLVTVREQPVLRFFDPRRPPTVDEGVTACVMDYALESSEKNDAVFLGDSICRSGIEPAEFQQLTHLKSYNLGVLFGGLGPEVAPDLAQSYLKRHAAPRLMIFCTSPVAFEKEVDDAFTQLHDRFSNCFAFEAPNLRSSAGLRRFGRGVVYFIQQGTVVGWYGWGQSGHDVRDEPMIGDDQQSYRALERSTQQARGFYPMAGSGGRGFLDRSKRIVKVHPAWDRGVRRLASVCQEAGVRFVIRLGPIWGDAAKDLDFREVEQWLNELAASNPQLLIARDNQILRYPTELCSDPMHCNVQGALVFTKQLAKEVTSVLEPPSGRH
jgi:hypothetical protein